jgi:hypothetical protein
MRSHSISRATSEDDAVTDDNSEIAPSLEDTLGGMSYGVYSTGPGLKRLAAVIVVRSLPGRL